MMDSPSPVPESGLTLETTAEERTALRKALWDDLRSAEAGSLPINCYLAERLLRDINRLLLRAESAEASARSARAEALEEAAKIAENQGYYPDTNIGMRQEWVKTQIASAIRSLKTAPKGDGEGT